LNVQKRLGSRLPSRSLSERIFRNMVIFLLLWELLLSQQRPQRMWRVAIQQIGNTNRPKQPHLERVSSSQLKEKFLLTFTLSMVATARSYYMADCLRCQQSLSPGMK